MQTGESKPTYLLDLPPEIWSTIGKLVIDQATTVYEDDIFICAYWRDHPAYGTFKARTSQPAISRTCKVLREELLPYYYRKKMCFDVTVIEPFTGGKLRVCPEMVRWLGAIGAANRRAIVGFWFVWRWEDLEPGEHLSEEKSEELKESGSTTSKWA